MAFKPVKQYKSSITTTASSALALDALPDEGNFGGSPRQVLVYVVSGGSDTIIKFGDSSVVADDTLTSSALSDGNFVVAAGSTRLFDLESGQTHVSAITESGTATLWLTIGFGERI